MRIMEALRMLSFHPLRTFKKIQNFKRGTKVTNTCMFRNMKVNLIYTTFELE